MPLDSCLPEDLPAALWQRADKRPTLSGETFTIDSLNGSFRVHFTRSGGDAPPDSHGGVPESVRRVLSALLDAQREYERQGFRPLPLDSGYGGSHAIDVYLTQIDANGYAYPSRAEDPDAVSSCYIELEPSLASSAPGVLESVAAHELHHCVQFSYTVESHAWMYESSATWEQYQLWGSNDLQVLLDALYIIRLSSPDRPIATTDGRFEYAGLMVPKFWAERGPEGLGQAADAEQVAKLWEALEQAPKWREGLELSAQDLWGISLDEAFAEYSVWNGFACGRDDGLHYDPAVLPCTVGAEVPIAEVVGAGDGLEFVHEEATHTAMYAAVTGEGALGVDCVVEGEGELVAGVSVVAVGGGGEWLGQGFGVVGEGEVVVDGVGEWLVVSTGTGKDAGTVRCETRVVEERGCVTGRGGMGWWVLGVGLCWGRRRG